MKYILMVLLVTGLAGCGDYESYYQEGYTDAISEKQELISSFNSSQNELREDTQYLGRRVRDLEREEQREKSQGTISPDPELKLKWITVKEYKADIEAARKGD